MDLVISVSFENPSMERSLAHVNPAGEWRREAVQVYKQVPRAEGIQP